MSGEIASRGLKVHKVAKVLHLKNKRVLLGQPLMVVVMMRSHDQPKMTNFTLGIFGIKCIMGEILKMGDG